MSAIDWGELNTVRCEVQVGQYTERRENQQVLYNVVVTKRSQHRGLTVWHTGYARYFPRHIDSIACILMRESLFIVNALLLPSRYGRWNHLLGFPLGLYQPRVFDYVNHWKATKIIHNRISSHSPTLTASVDRTVVGVRAQSRYEVDSGVSSCATVCSPSLLHHRPSRSSHLLSVRSWSTWQYCTCRRWCFVARSQHCQLVSVSLRQFYHRLREYWMLSYLIKAARRTSEDLYICSCICWNSPGLPSSAPSTVYKRFDRLK